MTKIHLHIDHLSLPGYSPAERRAFIAALQRELASHSAAGTPAAAQLAKREAVRVNSLDLRPETVAKNAVAGLNLGSKHAGGRS